MATDSRGGFLLDTHAFLWLAAEPKRIAPRVRRRLQESTANLFLSAASIWEMAIKSSLGKLRLELPLGELIDSQTASMGLSILEVRRVHAVMIEDLPFHHRDPFDRLIVAQAICERLILVSGDPALDAYPVERIW